MENVSVRLEDGAILLPVGPAFRVEEEIKNVITVTAKTVHYWCGHLIRLQQLGIAHLFDQLDREAPLLQPAWRTGLEDADAREQIERSLEEATGLRTTKHSYTNWIGLDCGSVSSAIATMRRLVASNILCRREEIAIFLPLNPASDAHGTRIARSVAELLERKG
jgi:sirohydrochlorin cobaltochelatase